MYTPYRDRSALDSLSVLQEYVVDRRMANFHPAAPPLRPISTYIHLISHMAISGIRAPTNLLAKSVPKSGHFLCSSYNTVDIESYNIIRGDSPSGIRKHGVAVYIRQSLKYEVIPSNVPNLICLYLTDFRVFVIALYRPPSYSHDENLNLIDFLSRFVE